MTFEERIALFSQLRQLRQPWRTLPKHTRPDPLLYHLPPQMIYDATGERLLIPGPSNQAYQYTEDAERAWSILPHRSAKYLSPPQEQLLLTIAIDGRRTPPKIYYLTLLNRITAKALQARHLLQLVPCRHPESQERTWILRLTPTGLLVSGLLLRECPWCGLVYDDPSDRKPHWELDCLHNKTARQLCGR